MRGQAAGKQGLSFCFVSYAVKGWKKEIAFTLVVMLAKAFVHCFFIQQDQHAARQIRAILLQYVQRSGNTAIRQYEKYEALGQFCSLVD